MPKSIDVDVSRSIAASPEAVWAVLADLNRLPEWLEFADAVDAVSGPAEPGATYGRLRSLRGSRVSPERRSPSSPVLAN